jgi:hypothetical protein
MLMFPGGDHHLQEPGIASDNASKLNNPAAERDGTHSIAQPLSGIISSPQGLGHHYRIGERAGNVRPPGPGGK